MHYSSERMKQKFRSAGENTRTPTTISIYETTIFLQKTLYKHITINIRK